MKNKEMNQRLGKNNKSPLNLALNYLTHRSRSVYEIHEYLINKGFNEDIVRDTVAILLEKQYVNDIIFTKNFVENRKNNKAKSKYALAYELNKKGIEPCIIENVLKEYDDHELALKALGTKIQLWAHLDGEKFKKKTLNFLQYRGFNYDISISLINKLNQSEQRNSK